jgi:hypothetical protein
MEAHALTARILIVDGAPSTAQEQLVAHRGMRPVRFTGLHWNRSGIRNSANSNISFWRRARNFAAGCCVV